MMTLHDAGSGERVAVGGRGLLRIRVAGSFETVSGLRALLIADVLRRAGELSDLTVYVHLPDARLPETAAPFGIGPVEPDGGGAPGDYDIRINDPGPGVDLRVAAARVGGSDAVPPGTDLAALRLALLAVPYAEPAEPTADELAAAGTELSELRTAVAAWARQPSGAPVVAYPRAALDAIGDDADTPVALDALRRAAADDGLTPGARFETVVLIDRLLALDLPSDIGKR